MYKLKNEFEINLIPEDLYDYEISNLTKKIYKKLLLYGVKNENNWLSSEDYYKIDWHGTIEPIDFLKRIVNIDEIEVEDTR